MKDKLIEFTQLEELLGYSDIRSIENWCKENKVPILHIGKKRYTLNDFINKFIEIEIEKYVRMNYANPDKILEALNNDDKSELVDLLNAPTEKIVKEKYLKRKNSKEAEDYIKKLKAA